MAALAHSATTQSASTELSVSTLLRRRAQKLVVSMAMQRQRIIVTTPRNRTPEKTSWFGAKPASWISNVPDAEAKENGGYDERDARDLAMGIRWIRQRAFERRVKEEEGDHGQRDARRSEQAKGHRQGDDQGLQQHTAARHADGPVGRRAQRRLNKGL